jgi:hypothetical protein
MAFQVGKISLCIFFAISLGSAAIAHTDDAVDLPPGLPLLPEEGSNGGSMLVTTRNSATYKPVIVAELAPLVKEGVLPLRVARRVFFNSAGIAVSSRKDLLTSQSRQKQLDRNCCVRVRRCWRN